MEDPQNDQRRPVLDAMIAHWRQDRSHQLSDVIFASDPEANQLVKENLVAFLMAAAIDRGGQSFKLWNIPHELKRKWGHLDTAIIENMDADELASDPIIKNSPSIVGKKQMARTIVDLARTIEHELRGDANRFFDGDLGQITERLDSVFGIGERIAWMIAIQRMLFFGLKPAPGVHLRPKLDVHVGRVFTRAGLITELAYEQLDAVLQAYSDQEIAIIDQVAWHIGRGYCHSGNPMCSTCPINRECPKLA